MSVQNCAIIALEYVDSIKNTNFCDIFLRI